MLTDKIPEDKTKLLVNPVEPEVVLSEDGGSALALIMPPEDDLAEMEWLSDKHFSLRERSEADLEKRAGLFAAELLKLERKSERFSNSPTFYNRMANLAAAAGDFRVEEQYLNRAREISNKPFYLYRKADSLFAQNREEDAAKLFAELDLTKDAYANLRLASHYAMRNEFDIASLHIEQAVSIDPLDYGIRLFQGALRLIQRKPEEAIHSFRLALEDRPNSSVANSNIAIAYIRLNFPEKAFAALKRAVALNPLNTNAVVMLADLAFKAGQNEDAIPSLRYFVQFEQKNPDLWSRLARALLEIGQTEEAIAALKRQGSIDNSSAVWNNLGVAYHRRRDQKKSLSSFKHAMTFEVTNPGRTFFLAARNIAVTLSHDADTKELLNFINMILAHDTERLVVRDRELSDLYSLKVFALARRGEMDAAIRESESILSQNDVAIRCKIWVASGLISFYSLSQGLSDKALTLAKSMIPTLPNIPAIESRLKERLLNNIAFIFAETGQINEAERYLSLISNLIHREPYPTAVLGLIHARKGNMGRAAELYEEAIGIASTKSDKSRIRQKLNIELGSHWAEIDTTRAARYFLKAAEVKDGDKYLMNKARSMLLLLPNKNSHN